MGAQEPPEFFKKAQGYIQEGDLSQALQTLESGLQSASDFVDAWVLLAQVYLQKGLPQKSVSALSKALAIQPSSKIHLLLAQSFHLQGIYPEAIRHYQRVIELDPDSAESGHSRKGLNQIGKTPEEAIEARAHFEKAVGYLNEGKLPEGLEQVQVLLEFLPEHLAGLSLQATIFSRQEKFDQAIISLQRAVGIDSSYYRGFFQLAGLYHARGRLEEAIKNYRKVIEINPKSPEAKETEKRLRQIGLGIKSSDAAEDLINQARAFIKLGSYRRAYRLMTEALKLVPDNPSANYLMAQVQAGLGLWEDAINSYQHVIQVEPGNYASFFQIGLLFQLKGKFKEAVVHYQAAIFLKEDAAESKEAKRRLREIGGSPDIAQRYEEILEEVKGYVDQKDFEGALNLYQEASQLIPENSDIHYQMGLYLNQLERIDEAILAFKRALELNPKFAKAQYAMALILEEEGRISEAVQAYAMVSVFGKGSEEGEDAKKRVELLRKDQGKIIEAKGHIDRANELKKINDLEGAIASYQLALALAPQVANIHLNLGRTYFLRGQLEKAFRSLHKTLELEPNMVQALFTLGLVYQSKGLYLEAIETHQKVQIFGTDEREVELVLDELRNSQKKFIDRTESYQFIQRAMKLFEEDKPLETLEVFEKALRLDPLNFSLHVQMGLLYQERSLLNRAISSFQKAIEIKPWYAEAHLRLAQLYEVQQSYGKAIAEYEIYDVFTDQVPELDSQQSQEKIARMEALRKDYQRALSDGEVNFEEGKQHIKDEKFDLAKEAMQRAIFFDPTNFLYHSNLGFIYYSLTLSFQARAAYQRALVLNPEYAPVHHSIGIILEENQLYPEALQSYEDAVAYGLEGPALENVKESRERIGAIIASLKEAQNYQTQAYEFTQKGEDEKALEEYLKANEIEPEATVFLNIGLLHYKAREIEKAEKAFLDAIALKKEVRFLVQLSNFYLDEDRFDEALDALGKAIQAEEGQAGRGLSGEVEKDQGILNVERRVERLQNKLSASVSHTFLNITDNRSSSATNPQTGMSSSFGISIRYMIKQTRRLTFPVSMVTSNSFEYITQTFSNAESFSVPLSYRVSDTFSIRGTYGFGIGINRLGPSSYNHSITLGASLREQRLFSPSLTYNYRKIVSFRTRASDSSSQSISLSLGKGFKIGNLGFGYSFGMRSAFRREQESISHSGSLNLSRPILTGLRGTLSYSFGYSSFPNPDSLGRTRQNISHSVRSGLSYSVAPGFSLGVTYSFQTAKTNLGAIAEEFSDLIEGLVIPLTGFKKNSISFRASLSF